ncbi:MAG: histidine phosphatase family protein [Vicinamibacteria bacterium]
MKLLLVRHAIALDRDTPGVSDDLRPLTEDGVSRFRKTARSLANLVTADLILTSPLLRAKQTAEILAKHWPSVATHESAALGDGSRIHFEESLSRLPKSARVVAAVGHEPYLSEWTAEWLGASQSDSFAFKKGGAALIDFQKEVAEDRGRLILFLAPKALKELSL